MKKTLCSLCLSALLLAGCTGQKPAPANTSTPAASATTAPVATATPETPAEANEFLIVPTKGMGAITQESTEDQLKEAYGAENVKAESIYVGDGMEWPGLAIFPEDPEKRVEVVFEEGNPGKIVMLKVWGEKSVWSTAEGVTLGTDLATLEKLNGKSFELMGLGWDYGGGISNWNGGALDGLILRVDMNGEDGGLTDEEQSQILGDQTVKSDLPAMKKANPEVFQITVNY